MAVVYPPARGWQRALQALLALTALLALIFALLPVGLTGGVGFVLVGLLLWVGFQGTYYGLAWTQNIAMLLARQQEARIYDFLCVAPPGEPGVCWLVTVGSLYHQMKRFNLVYASRYSYLLIAYGTAVAFLLNLAFWGDSFEPDGLRILYIVVMTLAVTAYFYFDFIQSVILGSLIGMIASTYVHNSAQVRPAAAWALMTVQFGSYIGIWIVGLTLLPRLVDALGMTEVMSLVAVSLLRVGFFYAVRELIIRGLWRVLASRLAMHPTQLFAALTTI
jgi:hypothetical protein